MTRTLDASDDPARAISELAEARTPWLYGVRHHSPACATALPSLLEALDPTAIALELPSDLGAWIEWLGHPDATAPLAVAAVSPRGDDLGFYPFADFSPELVAVRWARGHGVPVIAIDLPSAQRPPRAHGGAVLGIAERLHGGDDDSWEHLVEGPATLADPERVRRAALLYGWALRLDAARGDGVSQLDLAREAYMRAEIAKLVAAPGARVAAVIGSFHAAALLPRPSLWSPPAPWPGQEGKRAELVSSLIPYAFELLDARSGYPAGIRDPQWQQRLWATQRDGGDVATLVAACLVEITRPCARASPRERPRCIRRGGGRLVPRAPARARRAGAARADRGRADRAHPRRAARARPHRREGDGSRSRRTPARSPRARHAALGPRAPRRGARRGAGPPVLRRAGLGRSGGSPPRSAAAACSIAAATWRCAGYARAVCRTASKRSPRPRPGLRA